MVTVSPLGNINDVPKIAARNNDWTRKGNLTWMKIGAAMNPAARSRVTDIPMPTDPDDYPDDGTTYIRPEDGHILVWTTGFDDGTEEPFPTGWADYTPFWGMMIYVEDENALLIYSREVLDWVMLIDLDAPHRAVERELSFYAPGLVRPSSTIFKYVAGMEFTIEAGAPNSGAGLEVAPSDDLTFTLRKNNVTFGTITFAEGSLSGSVNVDNETIIQPALPEESMYVQTNVFDIRSPSNVHGAKGLNVTIRGKIRAID